MSAVPSLPVEASIDEVQEILGRQWKSDGEEAAARALLNQAWVKLLVAVPSLASRLETDPLLEALAAQTLVSAVVRVLRNPEGWRQIGLDDFQGTRDTVLSAGLLQFLPEELEDLQPKAALAGAYTVRMGVPYWGS